MEKALTVFDMFASQALTRKDKIAISDPYEEVTYVELLRRVNLASQKLFSKVSTEKTVIAILLEPSIDFVVSVLACLKVGFPYIPLNASYPMHYLQRILDDADVKFLITKRSQDWKGLSNVKILAFDEFIKENGHFSFKLPDVKPIDDAYIIYTSGTTGSPKGVIIAHESITELLNATSDIYNISFQDKIPFFHSLAFDFSVWEIFSALCNGATLIIPHSSEISALDKRFDFLVKNKITVMNMTPSVFYLFLGQLNSISSEASFLNLRLIILGGEALKPMNLKSWFTLPCSKMAKIYNMYGITEGAIHSTYMEMTEKIAKSAESVIGINLPHVNIDILDPNLKKITDFETIGELCLSGVSISRGYLSHFEGVAEKFFIDEKGVKCFKTGDLVKRRRDGNLEYIGRKDRRLKIRGFRIDPVEIERLILLNFNIDKVIVESLAEEGGHPRLVVFLEDHTNSIDLMAIKDKLKSELPDFMQPSKFILSNSFPITLNGKVDVERLKENFYFSSSNAKNNSSEQIKKIKNIWMQVLNVCSVNIEDNFFDSGGDSLLLMKLHFQLQKELHRKFNLKDLVRYPSIKKFVGFLDLNTVS